MALPNLTATASALGSLSKALAAFLTANMPNIQQVLEGWPATNQALKYPALTIFQKSPTYTPLMPYIIWKGTIDPVTHQTPVRKCVGMYDLQFQLDLWTAYRPQLDAMVGQLIAAFNKNPDVPGIDLTLTDYFNESCHLSISAIANVDDEAAAQRTEFRALITVLCNLREVQAQTGYVMETIENTLETPPTIAPPVEDDGEMII